MFRPRELYEVRRLGPDNIWENVSSAASDCTDKKYARNGYNNDAV